MLQGTPEPGTTGKFEHTTIMDARLEIRVNGVVREHLSAEWAIDTAGGLPDGVVGAGTGIRSRTGSITWAPGAVVQETPIAPIGASDWVPAAGDRVEIDAIANGHRFRRFTGYIERTTTSLTGQGVNSTITDGLGDALENTILSIEPYARTDNGRYEYTGRLAYTALAQAGLGTVPPATGDTIIQANFQHGILPHVGKIASTGGAHAFAELGSRYGVTALRGISYAPSDDAPGRNGRPMLVVARSDGEDFYTHLKFSPGYSQQLKFTQETATVEVKVNGNTRTGVQKTHFEGAPVIAALFEHQKISIWDGTKFAPTATFLAPLSTAALAEIYSYKATGLHASYVESEAEASTVVSKMALYPARMPLPASDRAYVRASRGYENAKAAQIIDDYCTATLSALWCDEYGTPILLTRNQLTDKTPVLSDLVGEKVFTGSYTQGRDPIYKGVRVKHLVPNIKGDGVRAAVTVYQPENIREIAGGADVVDFLSVPDEEDWVGVDTNWKPVIYARQSDNREEFAKSSVGSWWQISFEQPGNPDGLRWTGAYHQVLNATLERLGQRTLKMLHRVYDDSLKFVLATPNIGVDALPTYKRGVPAPIIRAKFLVQWAEKITTSTVLNLSARNFYEIDTSWWVTEDDAKDFANRLAADITSTRITFDALSMLWDPRKQVGDVHTLIGEVKGEPRWRVDYLLTGYSESWTGSVPKWSCDVQALRLTDMLGGKTYADRSAAYKTYGETTSTGASYQGVHDALPEKAG